MNIGMIQSAKRMMMVTLIASIILLVSGTVLAQSVAAPKIAKINVRKVLNSLPEKENLDKQLEDTEKEFILRKKKLNEEAAALSKKRSTMAKDKFEAEYKKILEKANEMETDYKTSMQDNQDKIKDLNKDFTTKLEQICKDLSAKDGYNMFIDSYLVIYSTDDNDVTDKVIDAFKEAADKASDAKATKTEKRTK